MEGEANLTPSIPGGELPSASTFFPLRTTQGAQGGSAQVESDMCFRGVTPGTCLGRCIKLRFCGSSLAFFLPVSDLVQLCPCYVMNITPLCPGCEQGLPSISRFAGAEGFCSTLFPC